jgi:hypothetical protein
LIVEIDTALSGTEACVDLTSVAIVVIRHFIMATNATAIDGIMRDPCWRFGLPALRAPHLR